MKKTRYALCSLLLATLMQGIFSFCQHRIPGDSPNHDVKSDGTVLNSKASYEAAAASRTQAKITEFRIDTLVRTNDQLTIEVTSGCYVGSPFEVIWDGRMPVNGQINLVVRHNQPKADFCAEVFTRKEITVDLAELMPEADRSRLTIVVLNGSGSQTQTLFPDGSVKETL